MEDYTFLIQIKSSPKLEDQNLRKMPKQKILKILKLLETHSETESSESTFKTTWIKSEKIPTPTKNNSQSGTKLSLIIKLKL